MKWQEAMETSDVRVIEHPDGFLMSGPLGTVTGYDIDLHPVFIQVPDEQAVQRILEEFNVADQGWRQA